MGIAALVEKIRDCMTKAEQTNRVDPIFEGLNELYEAFTNSGDKLEDFVSNKGLESASRALISHRVIQAQGKSYDCLAIDLQVAGITGDKAKLLVSQVNQRGQPAVIDEKVYVTENDRYVGITPEKVNLSS